MPEFNWKCPDCGGIYKYVCTTKEPEKGKHNPPSECEDVMGNCKDLAKKTAMVNIKENEHD